MNRTRIDYVTHTWNPLTGCLRGCPYCYARRMAERFRAKQAPEPAERIVMRDGWGVAREACVAPPGSPPFPYGFAPTFYPDRLKEPSSYQGRRARILVCSMGDLWAEWVPLRWQKAVLETVRETPWHTFLLLTKYPQTYVIHDLPENAWAGVTVTGTGDRFQFLKFLEAVPEDALRWVSYEPAHQPFPVDLLDWIDWLVIGAETGPGALPPNPAWVREAVEAAQARGVAVWLKRNLKAAWDGPWLQELPQGGQGRNCRYPPGPGGGGGGG